MLRICTFVTIFKSALRFDSSHVKLVLYLASFCLWHWHIFTYFACLFHPLSSLRGLSSGPIGRVERLERLCPWRSQLRLQVGKADQDPGGCTVRQTAWRASGTSLPVPHRDTEVQDAEKVSNRWEGANRRCFKELKDFIVIIYTDFKINHTQAAAETRMFLISTAWYYWSLSWFILYYVGCQHLWIPCVVCLLLFVVLTTYLCNL